MCPQSRPFADGIEGAGTMRGSSRQSPIRMREVASLRGTCSLMCQQRGLARHPESAPGSWEGKSAPRLSGRCDLADPGGRGRRPRVAVQAEHALGDELGDQLRRAAELARDLGAMLADARNVEALAQPP